VEVKINAVVVVNPLAVHVGVNLNPKNKNAVM
jgi:hypothetical protein